MHFLNLSVLPEVYLGKDLLACGQHQNMECKDIAYWNLRELCMVGVTCTIQHLPFYLTWTNCNNSMTEAQVSTDWKSNDVLNFILS